MSGGWVIERFLKSGAFGTVYAVKRGDERKGVMKIENSSDGSIRHELRVLEKLQDLNGFPQLYSSGTFEGQQMVVMQRLGRSLKSLTRSYRFHKTDVLKLGIQMVRRLQDLRTQGFVHRDLHKGNIMTGDPSENESGKFYLIDFGESGHPDGQVQFEMYGNLLFASTNALQGSGCSPKDDLESLV